MSCGALLLCFCAMIMVSHVHGQELWIKKGFDASPRRVLGNAKTKDSKKSAKTKRALRADADAVAAAAVKDAAEIQAVEEPVAVAAMPNAVAAEKIKPATEPAVADATPAEKTSAESSAGSYGVTYSSPIRRKWRVGVVIKTGKAPIKDVLARIPIPQDWPEQQVSVFKNEIPGNFEIEKVEQLDGLQRLILHGRSIEARQTVVALMTYVVTTKAINPPEDTSVFKLPDAKDRDLKIFLSTSAGINFRNKKMRKQAEQLMGTASTDWERVHAIYQWVRENIEQLPEDPRVEHLGAQAAFVKKRGFTEDMTGLFIAMCRAVKVPARMVFVDGSPTAEFMLADPNGEHHWFPCDVAGLEAFGKTVEPKLILQKGDNINVPGEKGRRKFVPATGICKGMTGTVSPRAMNFVREPRP